MDKKRLILGILLLVCSAGIAFALYFFFFRANPIPLAQRTNVKSVPSELPDSGIATNKPPSKSVVDAIRPEEISDVAVTDYTSPVKTVQSTVVSDTTLGLTIAQNGKGISYYNADKGQFFRMDDTGIATLLSDQQFFNVQSVAWSPQQSKAVIEYPDGFNVLYNFETKKQTTLPAHWSKFEFSKSGEQISAFSEGIHRSQNWLVTTDGNGNNAKGIEPLGDNAKKVIPAWSPDSQIVAFSKTGDPVGGEANEIYLIGQNGENFKSLIVDGYKFEPKWSNDGHSLMYSTHSSINDNKPLIWVVDANGSEVGANRRELGISTWAHKCTFDSNNSLICAVPNELPRGAGFAPEIADSTPDTFYKIDTITGLKSPLPIPENSVNATELQVSQDGQFLYYKNRFSGAIEKIKMK